MTECVPESEAFEYDLLNFLDDVRALASGDAEGGPFSYFLAHEYLWELQRLAPRLLESPASYLTRFEQAAIGRFVGLLPATGAAVSEAQRRHPGAPEVAVLPAWPDWRHLPALPAWRELAAAATLLLQRVRASARRNDHHFAPALGAEPSHPA